MKNKLKKGFTLTELVIVIVIIAILAAVLIPTYTGLVQKAKDSNDTNLVKLLNDALTTAEIEKQPATMHDAVLVLDDIGYKVPSLQAKASKNTLVWNQVTNRFYIYSNGEVDIRDASPDPSQVEYNGAKLTAEANKYTFWVISDAVNPTFSTYYTGTDATINTSKGFDAGYTDCVTTINYTNNDSCQYVVIRSNSASTNVKVTAPLDTISHYGSAGAVTLTKVSTSSFWEYGKVAFVELTEGRIVLTEDSDVEVINVTKKADATAEANDYYYNPIIADGGVLEENMPEIISRDQVELPEGISQTQLVQIQTLDSNGEVISGETEQVYSYRNGNPSSGSTVQTSTQNSEVSTTLGYIVLDSANSAGQKAYSEAQKIEEKDTVVTKAVDKEIADADESGYWITCAADSFAAYADGTYGDGTEAKPYLIKTARQLALLAKYTATSLSNTIYSKYCNANVYYELGADIDLSGKAWTPICQYSSNPFLGHFDGKGHTISNLTNNGISVTQYSIDTDYEYEVIPTCTAGAESGGAYGLFAIVGEATISNINFENFRCENPSEGTGYRGVGAVAGLTYGKTANSTLTITNCNVLSGNINVIGKAGGIVGDINDGGEFINCTITNCSNYANVTVDRGSSTTEAGGIVGRFEKNYSLTLDDCHNYGIIKSSSSTQGHVGGLIGCYMCGGNGSTNTLTIKNSSSIAASELSSPVQTGLIMGTFNGSYATITFDFENISIETKQENSTYNRTLITDITNCQVFGHNDEFYGEKSELDYTYTVNDSTTTLKYSIIRFVGDYSSSKFTLKNN